MSKLRMSIGYYCNLTYQHWIYMTNCWLRIKIWSFFEEQKQKEWVITLPDCINCSLIKLCRWGKMYQTAAPIQKSTSRGDWATKKQCVNCLDWIWLIRLLSWLRTCQNFIMFQNFSVEVCWSACLLLSDER